MVDEAALGRAHTVRNQRLNARIKALPVMSEVAYELAGLRALINTT